jgi:hypothetical protein
MEHRARAEKAKDAATASVLILSPPTNHDAARAWGTPDSSGRGANNTRGCRMNPGVPELCQARAPHRVASFLSCNRKVIRVS